MSAVMPTYGRVEKSFVKGEGLYLWDDADRRYLDLTTGIAVTTLGHSHPHLIAALTEQAQKVWHTSNLYRIPGQERLAQRLVDNCFADLVFFCNSGAEALEGVIKTARKYQYVSGHPEKTRIIAFEGAFHGRTLGTLSAGANAAHREGFGPMVDGFDHVPFGNLNAVRAAITDQTAAILVEPVQGESGINYAEDGFLRKLRTAADEFGLLLCLDEVQCGMGRTGKLFAHQWEGIEPDVMALAKGLGGGFPMGAVLATEAAAAGMVPGTHGSTFGGNMLAAACGNAVLDVLLEDGFLDRVGAIGQAFIDRIQKVVDAHPTVLESVRGKGLMIGIKCVVPNGDVVTALRDNGVLSVPAGDNICRFLPPLVIEDSHIDEAIAALEAACEGLESQA